ncbi:XshC-Cox1-family protein [Desulfotomaculum nigrificans CO-1-SRB]|uniref:XshC-Cox1-family protein n=1 Tax=Desulfotomaculum nigrificans (strain DSM 14880 / VKM B-2319 / CO-1-SRB) TaxID=868595 RepID=F6B6P3_DESCC|nr:XdhC/CoxI family protein [Desulfotomaculum nigrificans]AEF94417.1 XshC-Cox1-family protein [Desulfotomaculum nigrificans CO-1-SRB]
MKKLAKALLHLLKRGESVVQATILNQSGSAPRTAGAKMIIRPDKSIMGTIGGGQLEAMVQQLGAAVFETKKPVIKEFNLTGPEKGQMDMICGGRLEVLVEYLDATNNRLLNVYEETVNAIDFRKKAILVTPLSSREEDYAISEPFLVKADGSVTGALEGPGQDLSSFVSLAKSRYPQVIFFEGKKYLVEPVSNGGTVYIFGAGHVSQKLAYLTTMVDFKTVVLDDREEFACKERFPAVDEIIVLESFEQAFNNLDIDRNSYIVIVTRGHAHDKTVLAQALNTSAGYIGMIGSKSKRNAIYKALKEEGFTDKDIARVFSPIGLEILAETPEEIAVSITAELIKVRAGQN